MTTEIWAIDLLGGQAVVHEEGNWYIISIDNDWIAEKLRDKSDAIGWANSVPAVSNNQIFGSLSEAIEYIRQAHISNLDIEHLTIDSVKHLIPAGFISRLNVELPITIQQQVPTFIPPSDAGETLQKNVVESVEQTMNGELLSYSPRRLAILCREKPAEEAVTSLNNDYCFELTRRAFALEDQESLRLVLEIYQKIWSKRWISDPQMLESQGYTVEDYKSIAFIKCYRKIGGNGFTSMTSFTHILRYLHKTLLDTIVELSRTAEMRRIVSYTTHDSVDPLELIASINPTKELEKKLIWETINRRVAMLLSKESDRLLFDYWLRLELRPREIQNALSEFFPDVRAVQVAQQRIRKHIFRDQILRDLVKELV